MAGVVNSKLKQWNRSGCLSSRAFEHNPKPVRRAQTRLHRSRLLQDVLRHAHWSKASNFEDHVNADFFRRLLNGCDVGTAEVSGAGVVGTLGMKWSFKELKPCSRTYERAYSEKGSYTFTVLADLTLTLTRQGAGDRQIVTEHTVADVEVMRLSLPVGVIDDRVDVTNENPRLPWTTTITNGITRGMATLVGPPQPYAARCHPPAVVDKGTVECTMQFKHKERIRLYHEKKVKDLQTHVFVTGASKTVAAVHAVGALLGSDNYAAVEPLVMRAAGGSAEVESALKSTVLRRGVPESYSECAAFAFPEPKADPKGKGGKRKRVEAAAADNEAEKKDEPTPKTPEEEMANLADHMFPALDFEEKASTMEWMLRKFGRAVALESFDLRDHATNMYFSTPGKTMSELISEKFGAMCAKMRTEFGKVNAARKKEKEDDVALPRDKGQNRLLPHMALLTGHSYHDISVDVRNQVRAICDAFIRQTETALWNGCWGPYKKATHTVDSMSNVATIGAVDKIQRLGAEKARLPNSTRGTDQVGYGTCPLDGPEGENIGLTQYRACGAYHAPARIPWVAGVGPKPEFGLPAPVARLLGPYLTRWRLPGDEAADKVLASGVPVLVGTEEVQTRWVGSIPEERAEKAFLELEAAVMEHAAQVAKDPSSSDQDWLAAACVSVSLRPDAVTGVQGPLCLRIDCGGGRLCQPLLVLPEELRLRDGNTSADDIERAMKPLSDARTMRELVACRSVRFMDANGKTRAVPGTLEMVWQKPTVPYTHIEVHPALRLSLNVASMALCEHNPPSRTGGASNQHHQCLELLITSTGFISSSVNALCHASKKMLKTRVDSVLGHDKVSSAVRARVVFVPWNGNNKEDAFIVNGAAIAHGFGAAMAFKAMSQAKTKGMQPGSRDTFDDKPVKTMLPHNMAHLDLDGAPHLGFEVPNFMSPRQTRKVLAYPDAQKYLNYNMNPTYVHKVMARVSDQHFNVTVCLGHRRPLQTGDKLSNSAGCKGVCRVLTSEEMPRCVDGVVPDIIVNPQTVSQRCVYGKLMEVFIGDLLTRSVFHLPRDVRRRVAHLRSELRRGTPFEGGHMELIEELKSITGFSVVAGRTVLINPVDGTRMTCFAMDTPAGGFGAGTGMMDFAVLKQFSSEKLQARSCGIMENYNAITGQPVDGRGRCGGTKRGEMEYDAILCHGTMLSLFMGDALSSDSIPMLICPGCGDLAAHAGPCAVCAARGTPVDPQYALMSADFRRLIYTMRLVGINVKVKLAKKE